MGCEEISRVRPYHLAAGPGGAPPCWNGNTATLYPVCAVAFGTAAAVERCVINAVEEGLQGSIRGIERYFGMTVTRRAS